jgi:2-dehydro-3-deoxy-D-arabinonate dehydratase
MHLYRTTTGFYVVLNHQWHLLPESDFDALLNHPDLAAHLRHHVESSPAVAPLAPDAWLAPLQTQEVWAAGVTYFRSRTARMEESKDAGGGTFYDRVYEAERPEIFFKATPQRVAKPGAVMHRRSDSRWMVPEPELTLVINASGKIIGYTIGNDLSCRDIEGENPLYLPQAKCFDRCASVGPCILVQETPPPPTTAIRLDIQRHGSSVFAGETTLSQLKRTPEELAGFLYRDNTFATGALLMTGTGIVPEDDFTLQTGDIVNISIDGIGTLINSLD